MKNLGYIFFLLIILGACVQEAEEPVLEEEEPEIISEGSRVCSNDWGTLSGEFDLFRTWTFIGFKHTSTNEFHSLTCLAKIADFALNGEVFEDMSPIELTFISDKACQINAFDIPWVAKTIGLESAGCMTKTQEGIVVWEDSNQRKPLENPARNTLSVLEFDGQFMRGITWATVYNIKENRLYLYGGLENMAMVFGTSD
ncbi:MAG: hypothetical protein ACXIUD_09500 [Mongoliitalea sp.]